MHFLYRSKKPLEGPMEVILCERVNNLRHSFFHLLNGFITTASELREQPKVTGLVHCPGGNGTDPIWRVLDSSDGISSWTPLKPQHSIPCWLSVQWKPSACRSCQCSKNKGSSKVCSWICSVRPSWVWKSQYASTGDSISWSLGHSSRSSFHRMAFFLSLKQNFMAYRSSKASSRPDCIFEVHQLWQSGFSKVYSNSCCSCLSKPEIIKIGQSSHKMYSNKILNFQESTTILNACTKKVWKPIEGTTYVNQKS